MSHLIPLIVNIDVEPDGPLCEHGPKLPWYGFEEAYIWCTNYRRQLQVEIGAPIQFCWTVRLDPQLEATYGSANWPLEYYRPEFEMLISSGDEIGVRSHFGRFDSEKQVWKVEHGDSAWLRYCVHSACQTYHQAFTTTPPWFRSGGGYLSNDLVAFLDELDIEFDLSLTAGETAPLDKHYEATTGRPLDLRATAQHPYQPSRWDFRKPGRWWSRSVWTIPHVLGAFLDDTPGTPTFMQRFEVWLAKEESPLCTIHARTQSLVQAEERQKWDGTWAKLASHPRREQFRLVGPKRALALWRKQAAGEHAALSDVA